MNSRMMDILNRQELEEQAAYQSATLLRNMICQDFADSDGLLHLFDSIGAGILSLYHSPNLTEWLHETIVPVRTGRTFSIHKHTLCQIPYFHTHDFYELIYVVRGTCVQHFDHLSDPLILHEKQACLLVPGIVHMMERCGISDMILKFTIPPALFSRTAEKVLVEEEGTGTDSGTGIYLFQAEDSQTEYLVYRLMQECVCRKRLWDTAVENYLSLLFIALARGPEYNTSDLLLQLSAYFDADPSAATLHGFAASIGYSEHYTARLVRQYTGRSFTEQLVSLKMERAKELLTSTDATVLEIAMDLGYANASGFHKQFLSAYGMTPTAYRKLMDQENGLHRFKP